MICEIDPYRSYLFTFTTPEKPDSRFRERIQSAIDGAMATCRRADRVAHSVAVIQSAIPEMIGTEYPVLSRNNQYIVFALLSSGTSDLPTDADPGESQAELARALEKVIGMYAAGENEKYPIVAPVVVLHDCSVDVLVINPGVSTAPPVAAAGKSKWGYPGK